MATHVGKDGLEFMVRAIGKATAKLAPRVEDGIRKSLEIIFKKSQHYVPKKTMWLHDNAEIVMEGKGLGAKGYILYKGSDATRQPREDTAAFVHERLDQNHKPPTCAKFLERAVRETRGATKSVVKRELEIGRLLSED